MEQRFWGEGILQSILQMLLFARCLSTVHLNADGFLQPETETFVMCDRVPCKHQQQ